MAVTDNLGPVAGLGPTIQEEELLPGVKPPTGTVGRALKSGGYGALKGAARFAEGAAKEMGMQGLGEAIGAKADALGAEQERLAPAVMSEEELQPDQYVDYYLAHLFANLPQMAGTMAAGVAGRGIGGHLFRGGALRNAMANVGGTAGALGVTTIQNTGEIYDELKGAGTDDFGMALRYGVPAGALDAIAPAAILARVGFKPAAGVVKNRALSLLGNVLGGVGIGAVEEAITESAQEELAIRARVEADPTYGLGSLEANQRRQQAAILGGLIGGTFGGAGGAIRSALRPSAPAAAQPAPEAAPAVEAGPTPLPAELGIQAPAEQVFGQPGRPARDFFDHIVDFYAPPEAPGPITPAPGELTGFGGAPLTTPLKTAEEAAAARVPGTGGELKSAREAGLARAEAMIRASDEEAQSAARKGNFTESGVIQHPRDEGGGPPAGPGGSGGIATGREEGVRGEAPRIEVAQTRQPKQERAITAAPAVPSKRERAEQIHPELPRALEALPAEPSKRGGESALDQKISRTEARERVVTEIGGRLAKSDLASVWGEKKTRTLQSLVESTVRQALESGEVADPKKFATWLHARLDDRLKGRVAAGERETLLGEILGERAAQGEMFSRASVARPMRNKVAFAHWGNVPGGTLNPGMIGTGVPGRDQAVAKQFGVSYSSAVTLEAHAAGLYREPAVQARTPYVGVLDADRVYDWTNRAADPRWEKAKQRAAKRHGPDQVAPIYEMHRILMGDPNVDAIRFPDGQLRILRPTKVAQAPTAATVRANTKKAWELIAVNGGVTIGINDGVDHGGTPVFAVSPYKEREVVIPGNATPEQVEQFVTANLDLLSIPGHTLGAWFDKTRAATVLDVSVTEKNMQDALSIARDAEQDAIMDLRTFTEIFLNDPLFEAAQEYARAAGLPPLEPIEYREIDPALHRKIAEAYDAAPVNDTNPAVVEAFRQYAAEVEQQYKFLVAKGYTIEVFPEPGVVPYANSAEMRADVFGKRHLWIFNGNTAHPILTPEQIIMGRAVHDLFAHARTGFEFGPRGEYNAFRVEAQIFSAKALPAVAMDSLGQNAWVNFSKQNEGKPLAEREFAAQKVGFLPDALVDQTVNDVVARRRSAASTANRVLSGKVQDALDYVAKITGMPPHLEIAMFTSDEKRPYAGRITLGRAKDLIELAYNAKDISSVASHEGYHFVESRLLSAGEREIVRRAFVPGTPLHAKVLENAAIIDATDGTQTAAEIASSGHEARAYGFEQWRRGELKVDGAVAKIFAKLRELLERLRNYLDGLGFRSAQDVFEAIDKGRYARNRAARVRVFDQSDWDEWLKNVEPDVMDGLEHYDSRLARVAHYEPSPKHAEGPLIARGRPSQIKSRADLERIRARVKALAAEGLKYGAADWHQRSAKGALLLADGDVDKALTMAALISNFSPRTMVGDDLGRALTAYLRWSAGQPMEVATVRAPGQHIESAIRILEGEALTGRKRVSFLKNMMYYLDPETFHDGVQGVTVDMWMAHVFGFANDTSGSLKNDAQYDWAEAETFRIGAELGIKPYEVQAAIWVALRARANRVRHIPDGLGNRYGWFEHKTRKSKKTGEEKDVLSVRPEKVEAYLNAWMDAAMEVQFDADAFRESNISYLEAADKISVGKITVRKPAEVKIKGKSVAVEDLGPAIRAALRARGFDGKYAAALQPRTFLGEFYSRAAISEINAKVAQGDFERARLFGNVRDAMAAADIPEPTLKNMFGGAIDTARGTGNGIARAYNEWIGTGMATADKSAGFKNVFTPLSFFDQRKKRVFTDILDRHMPEWIKHTTSESEIKRATKVLLDRTINNWAAGAPEFVAAMATLTPKEQDLVRQARSTIDAALDAEFAIDTVTYSRLLGHDSAAYREWLTRRGEQITQLKASGYFPERRYGDHTVHVYITDPNTGKRVTLLYEQYESQGKAAHRLNGAPGVAGLKALFADVNGAQVEYGFRYKPETDGSMSFQQFLDLADTAGIELTQAERERIARKLIDADSVKMNRVFRRENVPGMSEEGLRVLAETAEVTANRVAYGEFQPAVKAAMQGKPVDVQFTPEGKPQFTIGEGNVWAQDGGMAGHYRRLADELVDVAMSSRPENAVSGHLRAFASFQFLGGSAAAAMVNLTSLWLATSPYLSQYTNGNPIASSMRVLSGLRRAGTSMKNLNLADLENPQVRLPGIDEVPGLREAMRIGLQDGTIQDTEIYQFMGLSRGRLLSKSRARRVAADLWMAPFRLVEKLNRATTFIAAYELGRERNLTGTALYKFAQEAVHRTQLRYDEVNRPKLARNGLGAILMTFKTFPLGMLELMTHLAKTDKRSAAYMLTALVLAAGVEGLPFSENIMDLVDTIAQRVFGAPFNSKRAMRNMLKAGSEAIVGADMSGLVMHGMVNWFTGSQFASRVGLGDIVPGTRALAVDADFKEVAMDIMGPVGSMIGTYGKGLMHLSRGDFDKALREGTPLAISNVYKGVEQAQRGYATDMGGRKLVDLSGWEAFMQGIGFSSARLAQAYDLDRIDRRTQAFIADVRQQFTGDLVRAFREGRSDRVEAVIADIAAWNAANPDYPVVLNGGSLRKTIALAGVPLHERTLRMMPRALRASSESFRAYRGADEVE